jgi:hypothetical protein
MTGIDGRASRRALACVLVAAVVLAGGCGGSMFGKTYEYEEDIFLSLDGSADITINASAPALAALRGIGLSMDPAVHIDREVVRSAYQSQVAEVTRVSRPWRKKGRRFVQVRLHVPDVRKLSQASPFAWASYGLGEKEGLVVYTQKIGPAALRPGTLQKPIWEGGELVAFRLHLPSKIAWHNARDIETDEPSTIARGNILVWEQSLTERLDGRPIAIEVRMDGESILHRTLWLFAGAFASAVLLLVALIWWTMRKGTRDSEAA